MNLTDPPFNGLALAQAGRRRVTYTHVPAQEVGICDPSPGLAWLEGTSFQKGRVRCSN